MATVIIHPKDIEFNVLTPFEQQVERGFPARASWAVRREPEKSGMTTPIAVCDIATQRGK